QCICGKSVKLDREYRESNLISHNQYGKCGIVSDKQLSTKSFFNQSTIFDDVDSTRVACCGLCDEKKKLFNEKFKENFSWKRLSKEHDELIDNLRCHAKWILDKISLFEEEVRTKPRIRAGIYNLKENEEIKENDMGIEINQLEENKEIEATNLEKNSKEDNSNRYFDFSILVYKTNINTVKPFGSLGIVKYSLEMKSKNALKGFLQRYKYNDQVDHHEQHKRNNYVWIFYSLFTTLVLFSHLLLYLEITFWFKLNSYFNKLLWSGLALDATVVSLDALEGYEDDTQVSPEVERRIKEIA
ncbi:12373_t:CDS:2, partial [Entrophospora sp. SA101]